MKILIIAGSGMKAGNTDRLSDAFMEGERHIDEKHLQVAYEFGKSIGTVQKLFICLSGKCYLYSLHMFMKPRKGCETFDNQKKNKAVKYFDDFDSDCNYNDCSSNLSADFTWKLLVYVAGHVQ